MNARNVVCLVLLLAAAVFGATSAAAAPPPLRVLILSGLNNHDWKSTTPVIEKAFRGCNRFGTVDITETPEKLDAAAFAKYDVIVSNWTPYPNTTRTWPPDTEQAFLDFINKGGGFVVLHAAACTFQVWPEFQQLIALTWQEGHTSHTSYSTFQVNVADANMPITKGLPDFYTTDELYQNMVQAFPQVLRVACKAFSAKDKNGTGHDEPTLVTTQTGKGRGVNLVLGHDARAMSNAGFRTLLLRSTEWAATGMVTIPIPEDWPSTYAAGVVSGLDLEKAVKDAAAYTFGQGREPLWVIEQYVTAASSVADVSNRRAHENMLAARIAAVLPTATADAKIFLCKQLSLIATEAQLPVLVPMLYNEETSHAARYVIERMASPQANAALLKACGNTSGKARLGIVNSLGQRADAESVATIAPLLKDSDAEIASAAAAALGKIGNEAAATALGDALNAMQGTTRAIAVDAYLKCADASAKAGNKDKAVEIYKRLYLPTETQATWMAALHGLVTTQGEAGYGLLADALRSEDRALQSVALGLVRELPGEAATKLCADTLPALPSATQALLLIALGDRGDKAATPAVAAALAHPDEPVRVAALAAAAKLFDASAVPSIADHLAAAGEPEREAAFNALTTLRGTDVNAAILALLDAAAPDRKPLLVRSLAARNASEAVDTLLKTAADADAAVRTESWKALQALAGEPALANAVDLLTRAAAEDRDAAETAVSAIAKKLGTDKDRTAAVLAKLDPAPEAGVRCSLLRVLGNIGDDRGLPKLREALRDADVNVKETAVRALGNWPNGAPADDMLAIARDEQDENRRALILQGLARLSGKIQDRPADEITGKLGEALKLATRPEEKRALLGELGNRACVPALQLAMTYLDDAAVSAESGIAAMQLAIALAESNPDDVRTALKQIHAKSKDPAVLEQANVAWRKLDKAANLALGATAENCDGLQPDGAGGGPQNAIDGNRDTYWDETNDQPLYCISLKFKEPTEFSAINIIGHAYQSFSPKDFEILCDGNSVKTVKDAAYDQATNACFIELPMTKCQTLTLKITASYGNSPGIRELEVYRLNPLE